MTTLRPSSKITLSGLVAVVTVVSAALGAYYALTESMESTVRRAVEPLVSAMAQEKAHRLAAEHRLADTIETHRARASDTYARREELDGVRDDVREMNRRAGWLIRRREQQEQ